MTNQDHTDSSERILQRPLLLVLAVGLLIGICGVVYGLFLDPPGQDAESSARPPAVAAHKIR